MAKLTTGRGHIGGWTVQELLRAKGLESSLQSGAVQARPDGHVTVKNAHGAVAFEGTVDSESRAQQLLKVLGGAASANASPITAPATAPRAGKPLDVLIRSLESVRITQHANDRLWYGTRLTTQLDERYMGGRSFDLPLVALPPGRGTVHAMARPMPLVDAVVGLLQQPDGAVLCPVHPQELPHRQFAAPTQQIDDVRCASSERTVHVSAGGVEAMFKLDLAHIEHSLVKRPISVQDAREVVAKTNFLMDWLDRYSAADTPPGSIDPLCFLPEPAAVFDLQADAAVVIRAAEPYPPPPGGQRVWSVPFFSMTAVDQDFPSEPPLLARLIRDRPDPAVSPLAYFEEKILRPLIGSVMRVSLDLGAEAQAHAQNTHLELGVDGQPTGRVIHCDLEDLWQHEAVPKAQGRATMYEGTGLDSTLAGSTIDPALRFEQYFLSQNLRPLIKCFQQHFSGDAAAAADAMIADEVARRQPLPNALRGFEWSRV